MFTNYGKQAITWAIGSDISNNYISYLAIGSGSGTAVVGDTTLRGEEQRMAITGSPDFSTPRKVGFQADFNSIVMSGITLTEFGLIASGTGVVLGSAGLGSIWQREAFGSIAFDGSNELQIVTTLEVL